MWKVLCLVTVILVRASYQRAPVLRSIENNSWFIGSTVDADHVMRKQKVTVRNVEPPVAKPSVAASADLPCTCGELGKESRILGGRPTYVNQYPWMAAIIEHGVIYCGGSLINNKYVMTAAHCVYDVDLNSVSVRIMEHDWTTDKESKHVDYKVSKVIVHDGYRSDSNDHDIALLRLDADGGVDLGEDTGITTVCLPAAGKSFAGYQGIVAGWGYQKADGSVSKVLKAANVPIMSNRQCVRTEHGKERITDNMMCAGYWAGEKDACQGDSGGPLLINVSSVYYVVGVVSFGDGCGRPNSPGVYTRVTRYLDWVADNTVDARSCSNPNHQ